MNRAAIQLRKHRTAAGKGARRIPHRRGAIFIIALAVIIVLSGLVLVFAQEMRTEAMTSANRLSYIQADAVEQAAEQWVLAQVESYAPDAVTITETDAQGLQVGNGYFSILRADPTQDQTRGYGITDECGKFNLINSGSPSFVNLPGMTANPDIPSSITDWRSQTDTADPNGAGNSYYESLQEPYKCKCADFESVDELLLIKNMTPQLLYGYDLNRDGIIDANERNIAGLGATFSSGIGSGTDSRGLFNYVTCFSTQPSATVANANTSVPAMVDVSSGTSTALSGLLQSALPSKAQSILQNLANAGQPPTTLALFYTRGGLLFADYGLIADQLTAGTTPKHLLNVNTASEQAIMALPTLQQADADTIIAARQNADLSTMAWFFNALASDTKAALVADYVTDRSYQYSADIVAVSGDGRSFKRVRIVVDASNYPTTPAQIIYRKDLTALGWPLDPNDRASLRAGHGLPTDSGTGLTGSNGSSGTLGMPLK